MQNAVRLVNPLLCDVQLEQLNAGRICCNSLDGP